PIDLSNLQQFDVEDERGVGRDVAAGAAGAVGELRRDDQRARAADFHPGHALVPAGDDAAGAELEVERLAVIARAVELLAVLVGRLRVVQPPGVVHGDLFPGGRSHTRSHSAVRHLQARNVVHKLDQSGNLEIWKSRNLEIWKSGNLGID